MGIKESNLPIAESLGSGDKLRIVTSDGASKQIGADSVKDMFVDAYRGFDSDAQEVRWFLSKTYTEIHDYLVAGKGDVILRCDTSGGGGDNVIHMYLSQYAKSRNDNPIMFTGVEAGSNTTAVTSLTVHHFIILADGSVVAPSHSIIQITA